MNRSIYDASLEKFVAEQREVAAKMPPPGSGPPPRPPAHEMLTAEDVPLSGRPGVMLRILRPETVRGVFLHMHGGGFVFGTPAMADHGNSQFARAAEVAVVSVDYRLAPGVSHGTQVEECTAAALWLIDHAKKRFGADRLLIGGDSAGANLAALSLIRLRDRHHSSDKFCGAVFNVGMFDISMTPSQRLAPESYFLAPSRLREGQKTVFPGKSIEELRDPAISPLYADLTRLPPAIFSVGTQDSVLDDTLFMAMRWRAAGNEAELQAYPEGTHLFMNMPTGMAAEAKRRIQVFAGRCLG